MRLSSAFLVAGVSALGANALGGVGIVPSHPINAPSQVQFVSGLSGFDSPKVGPINGTTYDWWYFDATSHGVAPNMSSLVIVFYTATGGGFDALAGVNAEGLTSVDLISITATWADGSVFETFLNGTSATFITTGDGVVAHYAGTGSSFVTTPDLSHTVVNINAPEDGVVGNLVLNSIAPPHYPCGLAGPGQNMQLFPHVGWANAVPDAAAYAQFQLGGRALAFQGKGYHDKNWGDRPFSPSVSAWYWGRTRLGPYSVVWFDSLTPDGNNYVSAYVSKNGKIITAQCSGIQVRPYGANSAYPPDITTGPPAGFHVAVSTPGGLLTFNVAASEVIESDGTGHSPYYRWIGNVSGGFGKGTATLHGTALFEQFAFRLPS